MNNKHGQITNVINIILLCLISYINFSSETQSLLAAIVSSIILTVLFSSVGTMMAVVELVIGLFASVFVYFSRNSITDSNYILNAVISVIDLYIPAFVIQLCLRNKSYNLGKTVYFTAGTHVLITCASLAKIKYFDNYVLLDEINGIYDEFIEIYPSVIATAADAETIKNTTEMLNIIKDTTIMLIPSLIIISCIILSYLQIVLSRGLIKMYLKEEHKEIEFFYQIRAGRLLSTLTLILLFLAIMADNMLMTSAVYNFAVTAGFIYFICGLSVVYYFLIKRIRNIPVSVIVLIVIIIASLFASVFMPFANIFTILFVVGLIDSSANFRRLKKVGD